MNQILITDTTFISEENEEQITKAGFKIKRLENPNATTDELIEALQGCQGYIIGGSEDANEKVFANTPDLKYVSFTGVDWAVYVSGADRARKEGIKITNTPGATTYSVAEAALGAIFTFRRSFSDALTNNLEEPKTIKTLYESQITIIGAGNIGTRVGEMLHGIGCKKVSYTSRSKNLKLEELGINQVDKDWALKNSDVLSVHVSTGAKGYFDAEAIEKIKPETIIIDFSGIRFDEEALIQKIVNEGVTMFSDAHYRYSKLSKLDNNKFCKPKYSIGFRTSLTIKQISDMTTQSMINMMSGKKDEYEVW